jgi:hypothetical protein
MLSLAACGGVTPFSGDDEGPDPAEVAADDARAALEYAEDVGRELVELKGAFTASERRAERLARTSARRAERMDRALARLRDALDRLRQEATGAGGQAREALAAASGAARDLAVLTRRFDYHLRSGGGD